MIEESHKQTSSPLSTRSLKEDKWTCLQKKVMQLPAMTRYNKTSRFFTASEMIYIVSSGALNSTHSL